MRIGIIAGEASGDLLGAGLIRELREVVPHAHFEGVAGPAMQAAGCEALEQADALAVFGLIEPLVHIPRLLRLRRGLIRRWTAQPPDVFVGIDAPDFNLGLEKALRDNGIPTAHYVSPSVWAWRQGRVRKVAKAVDKVLCLLPFEKAFYDDHQVGAEFVGHPLADRIRIGTDIVAARQSLGIDAEQLVAVLPGSRRGEVKRLGGIFAQACAILWRQFPQLEFVAPMASAGLRAEFEGRLQQAGVQSRFHILDGDAQSAMAAADVVLLASGTAALEAALLGRPMVAAYRVAALTYAIAVSLRLLKVNYFTLPNLLTAEPLVEEFMQNDATPDALAAAVAALLGDGARRKHISRAFDQLHQELARNADRNAARAVLDLAGKS